MGEGGITVSAAPPVGCKASGPLVSQAVSWRGSRGTGLAPGQGCWALAGWTPFSLSLMRAGW